MATGDSMPTLSIRYLTSSFSAARSNGHALTSDGKLYENGALTTLIPPGYETSRVQGLSEAGVAFGIAYNVANGSPVDGWTYDGTKYSTFNLGVTVGPGFTPSLSPTISAVDDAGELLVQKGSARSKTSEIVTSTGTQSIDAPDRPGYARTGVSATLTRSGVAWGFVDFNVQAKSGQSESDPFVYDHGSFRFLTAPTAQSVGVVSILGADNNGTALGYYTLTSDSRLRYFVDKEGVSTQLDVPGAITTQASRITASGVVYGSDDRGGGVTEGFVYADGAYTRLAAFGSITTRVSGISDTGVVFGYDTNGAGQTEGFLFSNGLYSHVSVPGSYFTQVDGVTSAGVVYGADYVSSTNAAESFVYANGTYTHFTPADSYSSSILNVSDGGTIFGNYSTRSGTYGFVATLAAPSGGSGDGQTFTVTAGQSRTVSGSAEMVDVTGPGATVTIGGNGQYASDSDDNRVRFSAGGTAVVTDNARVELIGDGVDASAGANDMIGLYGRGDRLTANSAGDHVFLGGNGRFASDIDDDFVTFTQGGFASVFDDARVELRGDGIAADIGAKDTVGLYGRGNTLIANGTGDAVWVGGNGRDASYADGDRISFKQRGGTATVIDNSRVDLFGDAITVTVGANALVGMTGDELNVTVTGAGSSAFVGGGRFSGSPADQVSFGQGGLLTVNDGARVAVAGDGVGVRIGTNDVVTVTGSNDNVTMTGTGSTVQVQGGGGHLLLASTGADTFGFGPGGFGRDTIQDFQATGDGHDTLAFDHTTFASVAAIMQASTQMGADVLITAGPNDVIRLQSVSLAALNSSNLRVS